MTGTNMESQMDFEAIAETLEQSADHKVLRRINPLIFRAPYMAGTVEHRIAILDTETTGLAADRELIEVAIKIIYVDLNGNVTAARPVQSWLEQPSAPLSPDVVRVTGLTDADLAGKRFDVMAIHESLATADLIVAHNAAFDRPTVDKRFQLTGQLWACSMLEIDWLAIGAASRSLPNISTSAGLFYDAHRAAADVDALAYILAGGFNGYPVMQYLMQSAARSTRRMYAIGAPFEMKDALKARGYKWNDGALGDPARTWYFDAADHDSFQREMAFLSASRINPRIKEFDATTRYK